MAAVTEKQSKIVANEALLEQLRWRYATKKFDTARKISPEDWATLEEALLLAPSSFGLQPWKFFVIRDPALREKLKGAAWHQTQVVDASHFVVFAARKGIAEADVQKLIDRVSDIRNIPAAKLEEYKKIMQASISMKSPEQLDAWCARQVYIALGFFLSSAAVLGIDACPMEGFEPKKFDEILGLEKLGYTAVVMATAGYRSKEDHYGELAKVRFEAKEVIVGI